MNIMYNEQNTCTEAGAVINCDKRVINRSLLGSSISGNGGVWPSIREGNKTQRYGPWGTTKTFKS
jgi:hypothetical protein